MKKSDSELQAREEEEAENGCPYVAMEEGDLPSNSIGNDEILMTVSDKEGKEAEKHQSPVGACGSSKNEDEKQADDIAPPQDPTKASPVPAVVPQGGSTSVTTELLAIAHSNKEKAARLSSTRRSHIGNNNDPLLCCMAVCHGIGGLLIALVVGLPVICMVIEIVFWWRFSAARGKGLECNLQSQIDRYYGFTTFLLFVKVLGTILQPCLKLEEPRECTCPRIIGFGLVCLDFYFALTAVIWIPDDATCPDTAPDLFQAARSYLYMEVSVRVVAVVLIACFRVTTAERRGQ